MNFTSQKQRNRENTEWKVNKNEHKWHVCKHMNRTVKQAASLENTVEISLEMEEKS